MTAQGGRYGARGGRRRRPAGFTLIELAAVVLVVALLYSFVLPNFGIGSRRALDGAAESLRASLELARQRSIATGARHRVAIDLDGGRYQLEVFETPPPEPPAERDPRGPVDLAAPRAAAGSFLPVPGKMGFTQRLSERIWIREVETAAGVQTRGAAGVEFFQDGSATAAVIALANDDGDGLAVQVLPLADTVRILVP